MAEGSGGGAPPGVPTPPPSTLKGLREQMVAAAQALAEERRNQGGVSTVSLQAPVSTKAKPVLDGSLLKSEERQRLARERREEREKQHAAKETQILEKEKKAKLQYEKQVEEKQKRLKEQKLKEQQRRAAVEQKRKQKIEEEKVHYEAVVHRTLERSQRLDTRQKRWSWSGSVTDTSGKAEAPAVAEASKRSASALNLKQPETALHKRLSSSAALLSAPTVGTAKRSSSLNRLNNKSSVSSEPGVPNVLQAEQKGEPEKKRSSSLSRVSNKLPEIENVQKEEKAARRLVVPLENASVSRLLAPTQASLARSKSAAALSAEGKEATASTGSPAHLPKVPLRSRSTDRLKGAASSSSSEHISSDSAQKPEPPKQPPSSTGRRAPSPSLPSTRRSISPGNVGKLPPSPATIRRRPQPSSPNVSRQRASSPMVASKPAPIQRPPLTPNVLGITKKKSEAESTVVAPQEPGAAGIPSEKELLAGPSKTKEDVSGKALPGTTTAEEASKILAEKRRLAREQREREDQEKLQKEEEERIRNEELASLAQEKQAQEEAALLETEELKRAEEEEQQRLAEKDRIQREQEEQEKLAELQLQREEAEVKALEEAEKQRQERERIMQQNLQERLERKKRIEEIMKRTRKAEQSDAKNEDKSNEEDEDIEEDEERGLEKQDQPEKSKCEDFCLEDGSEALCHFTLLQEDSKMGADDVFLNGNKQEEEEEEERREDGPSLYFSQSVETSIPAKGPVIETSEILHVNEADRSMGFIPNFNGKPSTWNFEEIIDLTVHPKTGRLSSESIAAEVPGQKLRDGVPLPASPKLAFEEDGGRNPLTKPIEAASEL
ncbi:MAP7 domain-containing protein 3 [Pseudonaja textilis]|uniref:MAP7 domain-containing protein 3 n=1 Tax=Pseudonaja textilis TaxID=8673 RepID=UPI000EAA8EA3|nr:MAP7 domain-containing protein 3 [Pseudonaja textilis]